VVGTSGGSIGKQAFKQSDNFCVYIADGVTKIKEQAFEQAHFHEISIPASVTTIESQAFKQINDDTLPKTALFTWRCGSDGSTAYPASVVEGDDDDDVFQQTVAIHSTLCNGDATTANTAMSTSRNMLYTAWDFAKSLYATAMTQM